MTAMAQQIVNVALPTLRRAFDASLPQVQWTVVAYLLSLAIFIPASGWIGDRIGNKRTFLWALTLFTVGSALCGGAQSPAVACGIAVLTTIVASVGSPLLAAFHAAFAAAAVLALLGGISAVALVRTDDARPTMAPVVAESI